MLHHKLLLESNETDLACLDGSGAILVRACLLPLSLSLTLYVRSWWKVEVGGILSIWMIHAKSNQLLRMRPREHVGHGWLTVPFKTWVYCTKPTNQPTPNTFWSPIATRMGWKFERKNVVDIWLFFWGSACQSLRKSASHSPLACFCIPWLVIFLLGGVGLCVCFFFSFKQNPPSDIFLSLVYIINLPVRYVSSRR